MDGTPQWTEPDVAEDAAAEPVKGAGDAQAWPAVPAAGARGAHGGRESR